MNKDSQAIATALKAATERLSADDAQFDVEVFRFTDSRLKYELQLLPNHGTAQLAADPLKPIQACPMLEYGFLCSDIIVGDSAYGDELAIRFYDGAILNAGLRLTMTAKPDGDWYIWANAVERPHE